MSSIEVQYVDHMGHDLRTVDAARVSMKKRSEWEFEYYETVNYGGPVDAREARYVLSDKDAKLIDYLGKHHHKSPFNHNAMTLYIKAPIFVARQLVKHEYLVMNEVSRRYVEGDVEIYSPDNWRLRPAGSIKQGSGAETKAPNRYGDGRCWYCNGKVEKPKSGPTSKWCSDRCRNYYRREHVPDDRLSSVKGNAEKRGLSYDLAKGDVEWTTHCPVLGVELNYKPGEDTKYSPTVDRIDNSLGYTKDNVMVMSNRANLMKNDASPEELVRFAEWILLRYKGCVVPKESTYEGLMEYMVDYYHWLLDEGYAPEQARMVLPQSLMTEWYWTGTLGAWAKMVNLRDHPDAQQETREVALKVDAIAKDLWPHSWEALRKYNVR